MKKFFTYLKYLAVPATITFVAFWIFDGHGKNTVIREKVAGQTVTVKQVQTRTVVNTRTVKAVVQRPMTVNGCEELKRGESEDLVHNMFGNQTSTPNILTKDSINVDYGDDVNYYSIGNRGQECDVYFQDGAVALVALELLTK